MWLNFITNNLIFLTSIVLIYRLLKEGVRQKYFLFFIGFTGVSTAVASVGHLTFLPIDTQQILLLISRTLSLASLFCFASGTIAHFEYNEKGWIRFTSLAILIGFMMWLWKNNHFDAVIIYGVISMAIVSTTLYIKNWSMNKSAHRRIITGIAFTFSSGVLFALLRNLYYHQACDLGHILVVLSLIAFASGFKRLSLYEIKV
jgi:hypothetical protein